MKKINLLLVLFAVAAPFILLAQQSKSDKLFEKYSEKTGFYYLSMETNMFSMIDEEDTGSESQIVYLKMLTYKEGENTSKEASKIYGEFKKAFDRDVYKGLIDVNSSGEKVDMMVRKENGQVSELVILLFDDTETKLIKATGNFDMKKLASLKQLESCERLGSLMQLCED